MSDDRTGGRAISRRLAVAGLALPAAAIGVARWRGTAVGTAPTPCATGSGGCAPASAREARFAGGAKGDGRHDDTRAIQAAVDAAPVVLLPAGIYRIAAPLKMPSGHRLVGVGSASVLKKADQSVDRLIVNADPIGGNRDIVIEKLTVDGSRSARAYVPLKDGICLTRCTGSAIRDVTVRNCLNDGIIVEYGSGNQVSRCTVQGNAKDGIYTSGTNSITVDDNDAYGNLLGGIAVAATRGGRVTNNRCGGNRADILLARDSRLIEVTANECLSETAFAISPENVTAQVLNGTSYPRKPAPGWDRLYGASSCSIRDNHFAGQVRLVLIDDSEFADNLCEGSTAQGIVVQGGSRNRIVRNTIRDWAPAFGGIQLAPLTASDGLPAGQHPPVLSVDNLVTDNRVSPSSAQTAIVEAGLRNRTTGNHVVTASGG